MKLQAGSPIYGGREELRKPTGATKIKGQKLKIHKILNSSILCREGIICNSTKKDITQCTMTAEDLPGYRNDNTQEFISPPKFNKVYSMCECCLKLFYLLKYGVKDISTFRYYTKYIVNCFHAMFFTLFFLSFPSVTYKRCFTILNAS